MQYLFVFIAAFLVDLLPFLGPPAWTTMVFLQVHYNLNIWAVLVVGVTGSAIGRYTMSRYIPFFSERFIKKQTIEDIEFIGSKLSGNSWKVGLFVLLYTLVPLPSTPLFTAAGIAKVKAMQIIPGFLIGKFTSDMVMVLSGNYVAQNALTYDPLSRESILGTAAGILIVLLFLFIDWRSLLQRKKLRLNFHIWK
jgi:membrane protein YqaA with SNARE-associated domain